MTTVDILAAGIDGHDSGVRQVAALTARLAYLLMCLTLCWGVLTATGWVRRATGHQALRGGHMVLAAFTLAMGCTHAVSLVFLDEKVISRLGLVVPFLNGQWRHALGIIALDLMIAIGVTAGLHRLFRYRNWLRFHQLAYVAIALAMVHSWAGAWANADIDIWWMGGLTAAVPAVVLTVLRFAPPATLIRVGLIDGETAAPVRLDRTNPVEISVDNQRCHRYGFCQTEAPEIFQLREDGRLQYKRHPDLSRNEQVWSAARACPMRAIQLKGAELKAVEK